MAQAEAKGRGERRGVAGEALAGAVRRGAALALLALLAIPFAPGAGAAAESALAPFLRFAPPSPGQGVRCFISPITQTETIFWGANNRGDTPVEGAIALELSRVHPDGTQTLLMRETAERLAAGESLVFQYRHPAVLCVTTDPRLPWPGGGRFRVTVEFGAVRRSVDALDP